MIEITDTIQLDEREIHEDFIRSSGPGGQNVNKVSTAVQLRFHVFNSPSISDDIKQRLVVLAGKRMTSDGELVIDARRFRSQERNRLDALERLKTLIREAAIRPKIRRETQPTVSSKTKRIESKRKQGEKKQLRRRIQPDD